MPAAKQCRDQIRTGLRWPVAALLAGLLVLAGLPAVAAGDSSATADPTPVSARGQDSTGPAATDPAPNAVVKDKKLPATGSAPDGGSPSAAAPDDSASLSVPTLRASEVPATDGAPATVSGTGASPTSATPSVVRRQAQARARRGSAPRRRASGSAAFRPSARRNARAGRERSRRRSSGARERTERRAATRDRDRARPAPARRRAPGSETVEAAKPATRPPVTVVTEAAGQIVAVVPGWVWTLVVGLCVLVAGLARRTILLAGRRRRDAMTSCDASVRALAAAVEAKDPCTAGHLERVQRMGLLLARRIAPADAGSREMAHGFLLHDVGKLAVPDAILNKPGRLDPDELEIMRSHSEAGATILEGVPGLGRALEVVRHHHERWDGHGYPARLAGDEIPVWARIFAVVDTLDAMTSERPYADRRPLGEALDEIEANAGTQFDPAVVAVLMGMDRALIVATLGLHAPEPAAAGPEPALALAA